MATVAARSKAGPAATEVAFPTVLIILVAVRREAARTVVKTFVATESKVVSIHVAKSPTIRSVIGSRNVAPASPTIDSETRAAPISSDPNMLRRPKSVDPNVVPTRIWRNEIRVVRVRIALFIPGIVLLSIPGIGLLIVGRIIRL